MPLLPLPQHREGIYTRGTGHIPYQTGKDKMAYWGGGNYPTVWPPIAAIYIYCPYPEGVILWVLGSFQGPLTCLWQLWRGQREVGRVGEPPPSQAVQAQALGVEAVAGQLGQCQSPSLERWGQGLQQDWESEQE